MSKLIDDNDSSKYKDYFVNNHTWYETTDHSMGQVFKYEPKFLFPPNLAIFCWLLRTILTCNGMETLCLEFNRISRYRSSNDNLLTRILCSLLLLWLVKLVIWHHDPIPTKLHLLHLHLFDHGSDRVLYKFIQYIRFCVNIYLQNKRTIHLLFQSKSIIAQS